MSPCGENTHDQLLLIPRGKTSLTGSPYNSIYKGQRRKFTYSCHTCTEKSLCIVATKAELSLLTSERKLPSHNVFTCNKPTFQMSINICMIFVVQVFFISIMIIVSRKAEVTLSSSAHRRSSSRAQFTMTPLFTTLKLVSLAPPTPTPSQFNSPTIAGLMHK